MNSMSITGMGIKAFVNTTVTYSTVVLKEKGYDVTQLKWLTVALFLEKCVIVIIVCLPEKTFDDHWTPDFDNRQSTLSCSYSGCSDIWHQELARIERRPSKLTLTGN